MDREILTKLLLMMYLMMSIDSFENETMLTYLTTTSATQRTQQITTILDGLLENYQAHIRPNFGGKETFSGNSNQNFILIEGPTVINFDILVSSFGPIQDMDMVCS